MKHLILFIVIFLIVNGQLFSQGTSYPKGGYRTYEEFKKKEPSIPFVFKIERRTNTEIKADGGNDFKITSDSIDGRTINHDIYAVSNGDTLFINCAIHKLAKWYSNVLVEGKYLAFRSANYNTDHEILTGKSQGIMINNSLGLPGFGKGNITRFLYVMESGIVIKHLNTDYIETLLDSYPDLKIQFASEKKKKDEQTLLKYLRLINSR